MKLHDKAAMKFHNFNKIAWGIEKRKFADIDSNLTMLKNFYQANRAAAKKYDDFKISLFNGRRFRRELKKDCEVMQKKLDALENNF